MFDRLRRRFRASGEIVNIEPGQRLRLSGKALRLRNPGRPIRVEMGRQLLDLYPDQPLTSQVDVADSGLLLLDPARPPAEIRFQLRLCKGKRFATDADSADQHLLFATPREAFRRHLQIIHDGDVLQFSDPISELGTYVSLVDEPLDLLASRRHALSRVKEIFGGPLQALPPDQAMRLIRRVNEQLAAAPKVRLDANSNPGALVEFGADRKSVIVGDLHGQVDNLLSVLSENAFLDELDAGTASLLFLGDAVHPDRPGQLEDMASSMLVMDLLFSLMLAFPGQMTFLLGNHDSFSQDVMKGGVAQGVLWERHLAVNRGEDYVAEMGRFYQLSPLVALTPRFVACHAGPPGMTVSRAALVEARQNPRLVHDLTWRRLKTPAFPGGYGRGDVRRFLKSLKCDPDTVFLVGHYPLSDNDTLWTDIGNISGHHLIYSSAEEQVGVFAEVGERLVPMRYPVEPLLEWTSVALTANPVPHQQAS
jgi:hypothetical protein